MRNKEHNRKVHRSWVAKNRARRNAINKAYYERHKDKLVAKSRAYRKKNKESVGKKQVIRQRNKYHSNPLFRMVSNTRRRIRLALNGKVKSADSITLIGCSIAELRVHIEAQFKPGMAWENYGYGNDKWNIDHIKPLAAFDLLLAEQQKIAFHFTNLQPLWQTENFSKGARIKWPNYS